MDQILAELGKYAIYNPDEPLLFNSGLFLLLFLGFYGIFILTERQRTWRVLYVIAFSLFFYYKSSGWFFILLIGSTIWDFVLGRMIHECPEERQDKRRFYLILSLAGNLGLLLYFKYFNFFYSIASGIPVNPEDSIRVVGISFFTFQTMSYSIDIYRRNLEPSSNLLDFAFFVSFFPQLVAGPIVRAIDFLPQIRSKLSIDRSEMSYAFWLIMGGLFKKAVISDYISVNFVKNVFDDPLAYTGAENLLAVYGFALQIYCDFSGYSDMAIGLALLMGFRLPINFNAPYQSTSITEFWRRWHISLSTWLRDYLYISLGGNRGGTFASFLFTLTMLISIVFFTGWQWLWLVYLILIPLVWWLMSRSERLQVSMFTYMNLGVTMFLGGLWHGANWRYLIWGCLHGTALAVERLLSPITKHLKNYFFFKVLGWLWAFHFVSFCWIYFQAKTFEKAHEMMSQIYYDLDFWFMLQAIGGYYKVFILVFMGYLLHFIPDDVEKGMQQSFRESPLLVQAATLAAVMWLVVQTASAEVQPFLYFDF